MKLQNKLSNLLIVLFLTLVSANLFAETKWEVATVFLGARENEEYQADVEANLKEISRIKTSAYLNVSAYREKESRPSKTKILTFLKNSFKDPKSKKALVIYGHGQGPAGLRDMPVSELKSLLKDLKMKLDITWFDACFLSNIEFLYELRGTSAYSIASEEAEFSSGLPFESLSDLPQNATAESATLMLAKSFIDSYSYLKDGKQRDAVSTSSATISVIDNAELEVFVAAFKKVSAIIQKLPAAEQSALKNKLAKKYAMDEKSLVDLGSLLIELRLTIKDQVIDQELTKLIRLLNIESVKKLKTNPRIKIEAPVPGAQMVFGFNNWENGHKAEYLDNPLFREILNTKTFIAGPLSQEWPIKKFDGASTTVSPFAPGVNSFDYYFLDAKGKLISEALTITRSLDVVEVPQTKKAAGSFLVYSAYTQKVGSKAEKYTGMNIALFNSAPSMDYFELEFNQAVGWLKL
ncbi:hypothetical protein DOM21_13560 [Bacteriovorax stolpii]|uniref:clostripain-related cysteine peptidase n=1 Tax=Bacteriovorax stolpii TaxID=960 RepID=UPI001159F696|nr:clostripain-related cysteine peptidase [Bacteriovorax stolpii]QDK42454.1 hypothetical protein DOM21_13560 [Bacteriovorax stolpii]